MIRKQKTEPEKATSIQQISIRLQLVLDPTPGEIRLLTPEEKLEWRRLRRILFQAEIGTEFDPRAGLRKSASSEVSAAKYTWAQNEVV
jgi:hypothetical protein